jgi:hypothetical protein
MWFEEMQLLATPRGPKASAGHCRCRPLVERLEDRTVLSSSTTSLSVSATSVLAGVPLTLTATVQSDVLAFVGSVEFFAGPTSLGTAPVVGVAGAGVAVLPGLTTLGQGGHSLTAKFLGDILTGVPVSLSAPVAVTVNLPGGPAGPAGPAGPSGLATGPAVDVSTQVQITVTSTRFNRASGVVRMRVAIQNTGGTALSGPLHLAVFGLRRGVRLRGATGATRMQPPAGTPYVTLPVAGLGQGQVLGVVLQFKAASWRGAPSLGLLQGAAP